MGIESDQLVFDYLSRVGDLAQQRQLPSGERMNLVAGLRKEIEKTLGGTESPAAVRRVLKRLGTPDEVVDRVGGTVPAPRSEVSSSRAPSSEAPGEDWWSAEAPPDLPGFVGGVEVAEILRPPPETEEEDAAEPEEPEEPEGAAEDEVPRRRALPTLSRASFPNPMLLLAAALLVVGAVLGSLLALAGGWLLAYASRRLTRFEAKLAVLGLPGTAAAAGVVWLWGRMNGRWGDPIPAGGEALTQALAATWPWTLRTAAIASALYLVWRSRRA
ncbi:hypothetical protein ABZO31_14715 [Streptomyces sp. HUAS MG47]|uniref:hypothetical protein n=1 Tax=Streptomyces solicamelliae TaxID=3231716 RepID=UPI003877D519